MEDKTSKFLSMMILLGLAGYLYCRLNVRLAGQQVRVNCIVLSNMDCTELRTEATKSIT